MFFINAIAYGIGGLMILFIYKEKSRVKALGLTNKQIARRFDYIGLILFTGGKLRRMLMGGGNGSGCKLTLDS